MLPNLIVIGAMKAATTSLHYYLAGHPQIFMSRVKELNFFVEERAWGRGLAWYESQFEAAPVRGETSPLYSMNPRFTGVPERMARVVPDARLIYCVRNPVERAISHYVHNLVEGEEPGPMATALPAPDGRYVRSSSYHAQIQQYLRHFPRERILVLGAEDLERERRETLRRVFAFLGVDETYASPRFRVKRHRTELKRSPTPLGQRLQPHVAALARRAPSGTQGYVEWLLMRPLSSKVTPPVPTAETRRALARQLLPDTRAFVADWGVGTDWLPGLAADGA